MTDIEIAELRFERDLWKHRAFAAIGLPVQTAPKWRDYRPTGVRFDEQMGRWIHSAVLTLEEARDDRKNTG